MAVLFFGTGIPAGKLRSLPGELRRFRRGNRRKPGRFAPPIFFGSCPKKTGRARSKRKALFRLCTQRRTGDFSDTSAVTCQPSAGCAEHCADLVLLCRKLGLGQSSGCRIVRPLRVGPGRSAAPQGGRDIRKAAKPPTTVQSLRPTAVVDVPGRDCCPPRLPGYARSKVERAGVDGQAFRSSTATRTAAELCGGRPSPNTGV